MGQDDVVLVEWTKAVGDRVDAGEVLLVVETDKSTVDVESPQAGWVRALAVTGERVAIGATVALLTDLEDERVSGSLGETVPSSPDAPVQPAPGALFKPTELGVE